MIIIIDGYNILKQLNPHSSEKAKNNFIDQLSIYAHRKHHQIIIVFDGGDQPYDYNEYHKGIKVSHSGYKQTADDVIKQLLEKIKDKDVLLVSSDRELVRYAHRLNIESSDALTFYYLINKPLSGLEKPGNIKGRLITKKEDEADELSHIMEETTRVVPIKNEDEIRSRKRTGQTLSKQEKRLLRKIKKL